MQGKFPRYEGEAYPEKTLPTYKDIKAWVKKKYGLIANTEGRYAQKVRPEREAAIREAFIRFVLLKEG